MTIILSQSFLSSVSTGNLSVESELCAHASICMNQCNHWPIFIGTPPFSRKRGNRNFPMPEPSEHVQACLHQSLSCQGTMAIQALNDRLAVVVGMDLRLQHHIPQAHGEVAGPNSKLGTHLLEVLVPLSLRFHQPVHDLLRQHFGRHRQPLLPPAPLPEAVWLLERTSCTIIPGPSSQHPKHDSQSMLPSPLCKCSPCRLLADFRASAGL